MAYTAPETVEEEKEEAPVEDDIKSKLDEIDSIASEALNEMKKESSEDPFNSINSMLGTSYDDFVPANKDNTEAAEENPVVEQAAVSSETPVTVAADNDTKAEESAEKPAEQKEIPPTTTDELPTVQETYDAETYVTNETYFGSADNMTYSIPDPVPAEEEKVVEDEFASGISGVDPTANGAIPPAPGELFTAPREFDNVPAADDEFAVTKPEDPTAEAKPEEKTVNPFTMINAEE